MTLRRRCLSHSLSSGVRKPNHATSFDGKASKVASGGSDAIQLGEMRRDDAAQDAVYLAFGQECCVRRQHDELKHRIQLRRDVVRACGFAR